MMTRKKMKNASSTVDRISELPEEIIHQILLDLDSYRLAARTSILSRRWLHLWRSYPVIEYDCNQTPKFQKFAAAASKRLLRQRSESLLLESFSLKLSNWENRRSLNNLLSSASLCSSSDGRRSPVKVVLVNRNSRYLFNGGKFMNLFSTKFLHLEGCDLTSSFKTRLDNLHELSLHRVRLRRVRISGQSFPSCMADAPRLEKLSLKCVQGIRRLVISASNFPSLKSLSVEARTPDALQQVQLTSAPLLETLCFLGYKCKLVTIDSPLSAPLLKFVEVQSWSEIRCSKLNQLISKLPSLESLYFSMGYIHGHRTRTGRIRISAHMLRKLTISITQVAWKMEIKIDAPNLVYLFIETSRLPVNINVVNVAPNCRFVVDCSIREKTLTTYWFIELRKRLAAFATRFQQLVFKLCLCPSTQVSTMDWTLLKSESSPLAVQHLQLEIDLPFEPTGVKRPRHTTPLLDSILSTFRPKMLYLARRPRSHHFFF